MTSDLLRDLEAQGVRLEARDGRLVALAPRGAITPELAGQIKAHKAALLAALTTGSGKQLAPLPDPLVRLIRAAAGNHLQRPGFLPAGYVPNLGEYVLACAALYACGHDPARQLAELWGSH